MAIKCKKENLEIVEISRFSLKHIPTFDTMHL